MPVVINLKNSLSEEQMKQVAFFFVRGSVDFASAHQVYWDFVRPLIEKEEDVDKLELAKALTVEFMQWIPVLHFVQGAGIDPDDLHKWLVEIGFPDDQAKGTIGRVGSPLGPLKEVISWRDANPGKCESDHFEAKLDPKVHRAAMLIGARARVELMRKAFDDHPTALKTLMARVDEIVSSIGGSPE